MANSHPVRFAGKYTDVTTGVHETTADSPFDQNRQRSLGRPAFDESRRVEATGHLPRVKEPPGEVAGVGTEFVDLIHQIRGLVDLPGPEAGQLALWLPRAEAVVNSVKFGARLAKGPVDVLSREVARINQEGHHRSHDRF